jgi:glycosyltransferase involved in cell wall biosynthesis
MERAVPCFSPMDTLLARRSEVAQLPGFVDLAIYDDVLPSPASPFRTIEYGHYLDFFPSSALITMQSWHFGFAHPGLGDLRASLPIDERLKRRITAFDEALDLVPKLAYVTFLGNAQRLLPYFEARRIPFILQLYPGGAFEPNVKASDDQLRKVVNSSLCRKVIATQKLTREHLLEQIGCAPDKVELIYGGVFETRIDFDFSRDKQRYGTQKETIDLCFVAHRYNDDMAKKGYDQFVEVARLLASDERLRFHVVGDYTADDLPLGEAGARFVFYGPQPNAFFADFYPRMDVIISANRPPSGREGPFDGFPTGACMEAGFRGVLNCIADPLDLNVAFEDGRDVLLIDRNAQRTAQRLAALFATPDRLYDLARANWKRFHEVFDVNRQLWARTRLIVAELLLDGALVIRPPAAPSGLAVSGTAGVVTGGVSRELRSDEIIKTVAAEVSRELRSDETIRAMGTEVSRALRSDDTIKAMATEVSRALRGDDTIKAMAAEVWRERRRRILPHKIWTETSRAWRKLKQK